MLETEIKKLRAAIEDLTAELRNQPDVQNIVESTAKEPTASSAPEEPARDEDAIGFEDVKTLAKEVIAINAMTRIEVMKQIKKLDGSPKKLSDLQDKPELIKELHKLLSTVKRMKVEAEAKAEEDE